MGKQKKSPLVLERLDRATQKRLDKLMSKNNEGELTADDRKEFKILGTLASQLTLANARKLAANKRGVQN